MPRPAPPQRSGPKSPAPPSPRVYRPRFVRHRLGCYAARAASKLVLAHGGGCLEPVPFDEPGRVVDLPKVEQRLSKLLDGVEGLLPQEVLLERADEALGTAVSLGSPHEGRRACDAQEAEFLLEGVGHVLRSMIVAC